jgi:hypothetical protein
MAKVRSKPALAALAWVIVLALPPSTAARAPAKAPGAAAAAAHTLLQSRELWSTIDVCNPSDQPDTVGVRGSMPGDHRASDRMYMRFRLQYLDTATQKWVDLAGAATGFLAIGTGETARQAGRSFRLTPASGRPVFTLRGVVSFQWRHGASVRAAVSRPTSPGRHSLAGADPVGFSAATCPIG